MPARLCHDLALEDAPDFLDDEYTDERVALIQNPDLPQIVDEEGAAAYLLNRWVQRRQARITLWEEQCRSDKEVEDELWRAKEAEREAAEREEREREVVEHRKEEKKRPKPVKITPGTISDLLLEVAPSKVIMKRVRAHKDILLDAFSTAGLQQAAMARLSPVDDIISLAPGENGTVRTVSADSMAMKSALPDVAMKFLDMLLAKNVFINTTISEGWE